MTTLPIDPILKGGLEQFASDFRQGIVTSESATEKYLLRINLLDQKLGAYDYVATESAMVTARAMDSLIKSGTDLGPLMGVPIAIKDIFTISGMPRAAAGSNTDFPDLAGSKEGPFIRALRSAGCVFLGKTKAVEFCLGITGSSLPRGTPWNPIDMENRRAPGGSSSGSAVATAADLCAFAIGTDSGGSVRVPATFNGIFGLKTTFGLWPVEGSVPLDPRVDSIGLLTKSAIDADIIFRGISSVLFGYAHSNFSSAVHLNRLRLGVPQDIFLDGLNSYIHGSFNDMNARLREAGCLFDDVRTPEASERSEYFPISMPASLLAALGVDFFKRNMHMMDPVIAKRIESGLDVKASDYLSLETKRTISQKLVDDRFSGFDAWVSPTTADFPPLMSDLEDPQKAMALALGMTKNTQPANYLGLCAISIPMDSNSRGLPSGYQLMGRAGSDAKLLAIAVAIERSLAKISQPPPSNLS